MHPLLQDVSEASSKVKGQIAKSGPEAISVILSLTRKAVNPYSVMRVSVKDLYVVTLQIWAAKGPTPAWLRSESGRLSDIAFAGMQNLTTNQLDNRLEAMRLRLQFRSEQS